MSCLHIKIISRIEKIAFYSCGMLVIEGNFSDLRDNINFILIHNSIVNGCQLLCDARSVLEQHMTAEVIYLIKLTIIFPIFLCL